MNSQTENILDYMRTGKSITPLEALRLFGCMRLGARCYDLKKLGYPIETETVSNGKKRFASYRLK